MELHFTFINMRNDKVKIWVGDIKCSNEIFLHNEKKLIHDVHYETSEEVRKEIYILNCFIILNECTLRLVICLLFNFKKKIHIIS